jgi:hypothetical protein
VPDGRGRWLTFLLGILTAWAHLRRSRHQNRPAAFVAADHGLTQHSSNHCSAASAAAGAGADSSAFAYLLEGLGPSLNSFEHRAFADLVAQAGRFEIFDNRLRSGFLL